MNILKFLFLGLALYFTAFNSYAAPSINDSDPTAIVTVYKSRTCGCCSKWVDHLRENGFTVISQDVENMILYKKKANLPKTMRSCHTAFVDKYAIEGHVPAEDIKRMLKEKPAIRGLAVPNMPIGSPGMEQKGRHTPYQTMSYTLEGKTTVYAFH